MDSNDKNFVFKKNLENNSIKKAQKLDSHNNVGNSGNNNDSNNKKNKNYKRRIVQNIGYDKANDGLKDSLNESSIDLNDIYLNSEQNVDSNPIPYQDNNSYSEKILQNKKEEVNVTDKKSKKQNFSVFSKFKKFATKINDITDDGIETYDSDMFQNSINDLESERSSKNLEGKRESNTQQNNGHLSKFKKFTTRINDITDDGVDIYPQYGQSEDIVDDVKEFPPYDPLNYNDDEEINALVRDIDTQKSSSTFNDENSRLKNIDDLINLPMNVTTNQSEKITNNEGNNNVDSILAEILPEYNEQLSIELKNVNLTFDIVEDKLDTIKESFIRTLEGNNGEKFKLHVLKNISFKIYQGEKVGIIGYNGSGKSTLLNVISGVLPSDTGEVITSGNISPLLSLGAGFDPNYSGRNNILLNGAILGYDKDFLMDKMDEIIEFSELGKFIDMPIKNYSSGMLAKLGFSIATAVEPDILIIDEILGVGDVNFAKKSSDKIRSMMDGGTTVLLVSHSIPQIRELCDKAIWIDRGSVREIGEVNAVCDNYIKDSEKANKKQLANIKFR